MKLNLHKTSYMAALSIIGGGASADTYRAVILQRRFQTLQLCREGVMALGH